MAHYDVLVIGAGVNGAGVARDCAMRGLKTLLVDKHDICHGASGANTGMIHGGARYLFYDVPTTRLSCLDSGYIQRIAPHLLFRIPFLAPFFTDETAAQFMFTGADMFFSAYDVYQPLKRGKSHVRLTKEEALSLEPGLNANILGAISMDEWGIDVFRLVQGNVTSAREHGATVRTYHEVVAFHRAQDGRVTGARLKDTLDGHTEDVDAALVVNAAGAWGPRVAALAGCTVKLRPGKGTHVVYSHRVSNYGVFTSGLDGRQMFLMPHENSTICGTTDDDYFGDLDHPVATEDEVAYIRQAGERVMPALKGCRMQRTYVGVRPTLFEFGLNEDVLSRAHQVYDHASDGAPGLLTLAGGKLASYRQFAEEATNVVATQLKNSQRCRTHVEALPGGDGEPDVALLSRTFEWPQHQVGRLAYRHGTRARRVLDLAETKPGSHCTVCTCEPVSEAEIRYVVQNEGVRRLADVRRRTRLGMGACQGARCLPRAAAVLRDAAGLSAGQTVRELRDALTARWRGARPVMEGPAMAVAELAAHVHFTVGALDDLWGATLP